MSQNKPREWWIEGAVAYEEKVDGQALEAHHVIEKSPGQIQIGDHTVLVDSEYYLFLSRFKWSIKPYKNTFYAKTNVNISGKQTSITMHRLVCGLVTSEIDHKNRNGLDNRKENLRFCTSAENSRNRIHKNSIGYRGVYKPKQSKSFAVQISVNGKKYHAYGFQTAEDAARAYDKLSKEHHGEFGIRNFED